MPLASVTRRSLASLPRVLDDLVPALVTCIGITWVAVDGVTLKVPSLPKPSGNAAWHLFDVSTVVLHR